MTKTTMTVVMDGEEHEMAFEDYAALWGCDPCYDHAPRLPGDGYLFYNFSVEGSAQAKREFSGYREFLEKFLPAVKRTLREIQKRTVKKADKKLQEEHDAPVHYETADEKRQDIEEMEELKAEVERRLKNAK